MLPDPEMTTKSKTFKKTTVAQGQEVEFHEIEIQLFQEVKFSIMRSKFNLFMRSNFFAKLIRRSNWP